MTSEPPLAGCCPRIRNSCTNWQWEAEAEHADIQLHLYSDSIEAVSVHLMDKRFAHEVFERRMGGETVEAFAFPQSGDAGSAGAKMNTPDDLQYPARHTR